MHYAEFTLQIYRQVKPTYKLLNFAFFLLFF
jgi:hypothetical protein